jgi:deoxyuridine 5'-triphosphate nucleotidohydrolase
MPCYIHSHVERTALFFDLTSPFTSSADCVIPAKGKAIVPTDIQLALPPNTYGRVAPRSGLAVKHFLDVGAGVIDEDYRGNVGIVMFNFSDVDYEGEMFTSCVSPLR